MSFDARLNRAPQCSPEGKWGITGMTKKFIAHRLMG
jgi:hypothetical protein